MQPIILIIICIAVVFIGFIICALNLTSTKRLEKKMTAFGNMAVRVQNNIIENNEDILKETANKTANINKDAITTMTHAIKEGFTEDLIYCKHCGVAIDGDSKFCKSCGKEQ